MPRLKSVNYQNKDFKIKVIFNNGKFTYFNGVDVL